MKRIFLLLVFLLGGCTQATMQKLAVFNRSNSSIRLCFAKHACDPQWKHMIQPNSEKILFSADLMYRENKPLYIAVGSSAQVYRYTLSYQRSPDNCDMRRHHGRPISNKVSLKKGTIVIDEIEYDANVHELSLVFTEDEELHFNRVTKIEPPVCKPKCRFFPRCQHN